MMRRVKEEDEGGRRGAMPRSLKFTLLRSLDVPDV